MTNLLKALDLYARRSPAANEGPAAVSPAVEACLRVISKSPNVESQSRKDVEERLGDIARNAAGRKLDAVSDRDLRLALQVLNEDPLVGVPGAPEIFIDEAMRRESRFISKSLYRAYLNHFDAASSLTAQLSRAVEQRVGDLRGAQREAVRQHELLALAKAPGHVARIVMDSPDPQAAMETLGLRGELQISAFACAAMDAASEEVTEACRAGNLDTLKKFISWTTLNGKAITGAEGTLMRALILPFDHSTPQEPVKAYIVQHFLNIFGDPRLVTGEAGWPNVGRQDGEYLRDSAIAIVKRWLATEFLQLFIKIIDETATERMWEARKEFWLPYFENDHVADVTLILSTEAASLARSMQEQDESLSHLTWSDLTGAQSNQSVLLFQIADLTVAEWSHNGKMRFWRRDHEVGPKLHQKIYQASKL